MACTVVSKLCLGCGFCTEVCPRKAIIIELKLARINEDLCDGCEECVFACPNGAITGC